ncbi:MAG: hypothetical protein ACHQHN_16995 [Sphingobacteriales bacterium]
MKFTPALLFIIVIMAFTACKKSGNGAVEGKWQKVKMRVYNQDINTGAISNDTTYQANTFGSFDYVQFNSNGTCVLSETGFIGTESQVIATQDKQNYTYAKSGSGFALTLVQTNPSVISGIGTTFTVSSVSGNTLILHAVNSYLNPSVPYKTISDSYYTK